MPSVTQNPSASSSSWPGVRIVTATGSPPIRISRGSSTATTSPAFPPGTRVTVTRAIDCGGASTRAGLLDRDGLGEVARLVDVQPAQACDAVGKELQRHDRQDGL